MAQQNITIGTADAGNGDTLFAAFTKTEANFTDLYGGAGIADGSVTFAKLDTALVIPEAAGIAANDNDTTVPSSAAVKDYVDASVPTYTDFYVTGNLGYDSTDYITWTDNTQMDFYVNALNQMRLEADGDLHVEGDVIAYSTTVSSDERLKENIEVIDNPLEKIDEIKGVTFDYKRNGRKSGGLIAQDLEKVLPSLIQEQTSLDGSDTYKTVDYNGVVGLLIESVKELKKEIEILKAK